MQLADFTENDRFDPQKMAVVLHTSAEEVAMTAGLNDDALQNHTMMQSDKTQCRLRDMAMVLDKVTPLIGSPLRAYAWYRSETIPRFGGLTAMQLVQEGKAHRVLKYIDGVLAGVYA